MKFRILSLFFLSIFLFSCSSENSEVLEEDVEDVEDLEDTEEIEDVEDVGDEEEMEETIINYTEHVAPIIMDNCLECHGEVNPSVGLSLTSYDLLVSNYVFVQDRINDSINPMPPSGLMSEENRTIIDEWIEGGLLEN